MNTIYKNACYVFTGLLPNALFGYNLTNWETWAFMIIMSISIIIAIEQNVKEVKEK